MTNATCPECESDVHVPADADLDDEITCDECGAELTVVGLDPVELDESDPVDDLL